MIKGKKTPRSKLIIFAFLISIIITTLFIQFKKFVPPSHKTSISPIISQTKQPIQYVVLSFDGSKSLSMWQDTLDFAKQMNDSGKPLHFTYFISGVYFLSPKYFRTYLPPGLPAGTTPIGFSDSSQDVINRIGYLNTAKEQGHEIASHANGHFRGGIWSLKSWSQEFSEFDKLIFSWKTNNHLDTNTNLNLSVSDIKGFRAPLLSRNDALYQELSDKGFLYDSSSFNASPSSWPVKNKFGTWLINLGEIPFANTKNRIIAMDYNFYSVQSQARDNAKKGSALWKKYYDQVLTSYQNYFETNYHSSKAPVIIGHHFSLWNDGVYWEVMKQFANNVCGLPDVRCITFTELARHLSERNIGTPPTK